MSMTKSLGAIKQPEGVGQRRHLQVSHLESIQAVHHEISELPVQSSVLVEMIDIDGSEDILRQLSQIHAKRAELAERASCLSG
jgi:hypothetical protein